MTVKPATAGIGLKDLLPCQPLPKYALSCSGPLRCVWASESESDPYSASTRVSFSLNQMEQA